MRYFLILLTIGCSAFLIAYSVNKISEKDAIENEFQNFEYQHGAITRGDKSGKEIALVFTGDVYADGIEEITMILRKHNIVSSFFFTGRFYRNRGFAGGIQNLVRDGHYLGAHSNEHLLYCDWRNRDSLLVTKQEFTTDLENNYLEMQRFGIDRKDAHYFLPPFEWYNDTISAWTRSQGLQLVNFTHGTLSHADYTTPEMPNYRSSTTIYNSILDYEATNDNGLNGFILLCHVGTDPERTDKFYLMLDNLIVALKKKGYAFVRIDSLLNPEKNN